MAVELTSINTLCMEAVIRVRDIEITFRHNGKRLKVVAKANLSGGSSPWLSDAEYAEALTLAADKLGVKVRLGQAA